MWESQESGREKNRENGQLNRSRTTVATETETDGQKWQKTLEVDNWNESRYMPDEFRGHSIYGKAWEDYGR